MTNVSLIQIGQFVGIAYFPYEMEINTTYLKIIRGIVAVTVTLSDTTDVNPVLL